jgi:putative tricarboxylic transport membrane protein
MIVIFGVLGYLFEKFKFPISPTALGAIVGPVSERPLLCPACWPAGGDWTVFFREAICGTLITVSLLALGCPLLREIFVMPRRAATVAILGEQR